MSQLEGDEIITPDIVEKSDKEIEFEKIHRSVVGTSVLSMISPLFVCNLVFAQLFSSNNSVFGNLESFSVCYMLCSTLIILILAGLFFNSLENFMKNGIGMMMVMSSILPIFLIMFSFASMSLSFPFVIWLMTLVPILPFGIIFVYRSRHLFNPAYRQYYKLNSEMKCQVVLANGSKISSESKES